MPSWPDLADERKEALRGQLKRWAKGGLISPDQERAIDAATATPWKSNGPVLWIVLFFLTLLAIVATFFLFDRLGLPKGWITAALAIAVAELLIRKSRFSGTGVEAALWLGALFAWIFGLPSEGKPEALLLFAAASAAAGVRVRNALFGAVAAVFVVSYLIARNWDAAAVLVAIAISMLALAAVCREWQRPSTEMLFAALLVIPPIAGAFAAGDSAAWSMVYFAGAAICAAAGVRTRQHAPLIAAIVYLAIAAGILAAHDLLPFREEWSAIAGGAILLLFSALVTRALRSRRTGIVVQRDDLASLDEALQIGGALTMQPKIDAPPEGRPEGGGQFGGAGATGKF